MTNKEAAMLLKRATTVIARQNGKGLYNATIFEALAMAIEALENATSECGASMKGGQDNDPN